ncbi:MAG: hypothetical protein ABL881_02240, partial [Novosphingobium sp.]
PQRHAQHHRRFRCASHHGADQPALLGLPPFAPLARAAAALMGDEPRPARAAIHFAVPKMPAINPGME